MPQTDRRRLLLALLWLTFAAAVPRAAHAQPRYTVSLAQLRAVLEQRFPLRYQAAGVLLVRLDPPALRLMPDQDRVGSEFPFEVSGPALRRPHTGSLDLDFELRYERADRTVRAHRIRINSVQVEGLSRDAKRLIDAYMRASSEQALLEVVLHRLEPRDLALAETMGFEPGRITVTSQGLVVEFVPRLEPPR